MKRFTLKRKMILGFIISIIINGLFLGICYNYYIIPSLESTGSLIETSIVEELENVDGANFKDRLLEISNKYKVEIKIIDSSYQELFNNIDMVTNSRYLLSDNVTIDGKSYYIIVIKNIQMSVGIVMRNFVFFQILMLLFVGVVGTLFTNHTFLTPLEETVNDMNNYKLGRKPKKRKIITQIDYIQNEFVDLVEDLEEEKKNQNNIISSISHDIKTPLTSIIGYTHLLKDSTISLEDKYKYIDKIYNKSLLIKDIINDFDDYLITNSKRTFKYEKVKLDNFMGDLESDYKDDLEDSGISFEIVNNTNDVELNIDVSKIKRVFSNIISNSVRYVSNDGKIIIICNDKGNYIEFIVSDNGCSVPEENLIKIFEPLYTTDPSRKISGLGLAICRDIIEAHMGKIKAINNNMGGLSIEFTISKDVN